MALKRRETTGYLGFDPRKIGSGTGKTQWVLFIEETGAHTGGGVVLGSGTHVYPQVFSSRDEAQLFAAQAAYMHKPRGWMQEQRRRVLRENFDSYAVIVEGAMRNSHFRVSVVEELLPDDPVPSSEAPTHAQLVVARSRSNFELSSSSLR